MSGLFTKSINKYKNTSTDNKRLFSNFISLSLLQAANYLLPLITLPYLVRVLGPDKFGLIAFAQAFVQYFVIITDYGFNLSATREISVNRDDPVKVNIIFNSVIIIKFILLFVSFILMTSIILIFNKFRGDILIYFLTFGIVIGQSFFPVWFFQGMEKMKYITVLNITAKVIFTVCIFIFIRKVNDYIYVPLINSVGYIIAGVISLIIIFKDFNVKLTVPSARDIRYQLKEGWYIFISTIAISLYTTSNTFILGLFTNNTIVGYYSGAEKIIKGIQGLITPISQTIYPYISKLVKESRTKAIIFIKKVAVIISAVSIIISIIIFSFSDVIVKVILGNEFFESIIVLRILAFLPFIIALSNIFGIQTMLTFDFKNAFSNILISASFISIILALIFVPLFKHIGTSYTVVITEVFVTVAMFIYLKRKGINIFKFS